MQNLNVAGLQLDLVWHSPKDNRQQIEKALAELDPRIDLLILPEMFQTGFTMQPEENAESDDTETLSWMIEQARAHDLALCGSIAVRAQDEYRNRMLFVTPEGRLTRYDKRHLFTMGEEDQHYSAGTNRVVVHYQGWRILLAVCYDLRFPVWCRNQNEYDLMICVANWPAPRRNAWRTLLSARAIENQSYVIGVNRIGKDGRDLNYAGDTMIIDAKGEALADLGSAQPGCAIAELDLAQLSAFKTKFPAWADADHFALSGVKTTRFEL